MRALAGAVAAMVCTSVLGIARDACAGASARLVYVRGPGAEQCPGEQAIRTAVAGRLGYDPFFAWARDALFVDVSRDGGTFHVDLKLVDADNLQRGSRSIVVKGSDCANVVDAMALTISLTIDPDALTRGPSSPPPPPRPDPPSAPPGPPAPPPPAPPTPAPSTAPAAAETSAPPSSLPPLQLLAGGGAGIAAGAQPNVAAELTIFAGVRRQSFSIDLEGRADLPATGPGAGGVLVQSWLIAASLVPCVHLGPVYGCGVGALGLLTGTSVNTPSPAQNGTLWAAAGPRLGVELALSSGVGIRAWGEVLLTLQDTLVFNNQQVYQFPSASGGAALGLFWRFS